MALNLTHRELKLQLLSDGAKGYFRETTGGALYKRNQNYVEYL